MDNSTSKTVLFSVILLILSFLIGPLIGYLFFGILFLIGLRKIEFLLVALFSVGTFKNLDFFQSFPIDLTVFIFGAAIYLTFLLVLFRSKINKVGLIGILVLAQGLLALFSAAFVSGAEDLRWWEAGRFLVFNLPLFFLPLIIIYNKSQIRNIILAIYFVSVLLLGSAFHNLYFQKLTSWSLTALGESYIGLSLYLSFGIIFLLYCLLCQKSKILIKVLYFFLLMFFIAGLILAPSRGIFISLALTLIILFLKIFIDKKVRFKKVFFLTFLTLSIIGVGFLIFQTAKVAGFGVSRLIPSMVQDQSSIEKRIQYFNDSVKDFSEYPITGKGVGMFSYEHGGKGNYPHNIFLEVAAEYGLIGIIIFCSFFVYLLYLALRNIKALPLNSIFLLIPFWFLIMFSDAMVSGNIANNRDIWFLGAIMLIFSKIIKKKQQINPSDINQTKN